MAARQQLTRKTTPPQKELTLRERFSTRSRTFLDSINRFIKRHPLASFLLVLGLLLLLLLAGRFLQKAPEEPTEQKITKQVTVYSIGEGPQATFQAKVEKSGVVQIIAQAGGIVQDIPVKEGQVVHKGQLIVSLSSNYQGGNAASVQRQIAQTQYQNALDSYGPQMDLIQKQKDIATASAAVAQQTRDITRQSVNDTNSLINQNQSQLEQMQDQLSALQGITPSGFPNPLIPLLQGSINQMQGGINQLRTTQRTAELQSSEDRPPAQLANLQKEAAIKQLEIQEKSISLSKDVAKLQVNLAYVNEALMFPASPFAGTVEKINIREGQAVNPGTVLATVTANNVETSAVLLVPQNISQVIATGEPSYLQINDKRIAVTPYYVSTQATDGQLFSIYYDIPAAQQKYLSDGEFISVSVPLGKANTPAATPLIPIDAVHQNQDKAFVLIAEKNKAVTRTITTSNVFGSYVEVPSGLKQGDQIILNRNVIADDSVKIQ